MRLAATRTVNVRDVNPNERFTNDKGRWIVDHVVRKSDEVAIAAFPDGRNVSKRTVFTYKLGDEITVELNPADNAAVIEQLIKALAASDEDAVAIAKFDGPGDYPVWVLTGTSPQPWRLELEP